MITLKGSTFTQSVMSRVKGEIGTYFPSVKQFSLHYKKDMSDVLYSIYSLGHPPHISQKSASLYRSLTDVRGRGCRQALSYNSSSIYGSILKQNGSQTKF